MRFDYLDIVQIRDYLQYQIKQNNSKLFGQISAFFCVHLRLILVSLSDRIRKIKFYLFSIQEKIEPVNNNQTNSCLGLLNNKPQINADERRFVHLNIKRFSEVNHRKSRIKSPQSTQRAQSIATMISEDFALGYEKIYNELVPNLYELTPAIRKVL